MISFDANRAKAAIVAWLRQFFDRIGLQRGVVGLSGGLDSSVAACLSCEALGAENVWGVILPFRFTPKEEVKNAARLAKHLGMNWVKIDISAPVDALAKSLGKLGLLDRLSLGNFQARVRSAILYQRANVHHAVVIGSINKTEWLLGYTTKYTEGDVLPLACLYKTQVKELAKHLGLPESVVERISSANLWLGQTDEGELSEKLGYTVSYPLLDQILYSLQEHKQKPERIAEKLNVPKELVLRVIEEVRRNEHKRNPPLIPEFRF